MTFRWHSLLALVLSASTALAGWDGFPCPSNVSWYAVETNHYFAQLFTGLVERCNASGVAAPVIVDTYTLFAGYTNSVTTNGVTLSWICYTNRTVTNQFLPFEYAWSQTNGTSGTATCYPAIKQSWIAAWDSKFSSIIGGPWVRVEDCGLLSNDTADAYFGTASNVLDFPMWTRTNLFLRYGIGSGTNGGGLFTHTPDLLTNEWALGAVRKTTNAATSWSYQEMTPITTTIYDTSIRPVFEYWPSCPTNQTLATSFNGSSVVFTITGTILNFASQSATSGTEVITITDSNDVATVQPWYRVTGITSTNIPPNSNDAWRVVYKESFPIYGGNPYRLYACDINERQAAIDPLICTRYALGYGNSLGTCLFGQAGEPYSGSYTNWEAATNAACADWSTYVVSSDGRSLRFGTAGSFDMLNLNSYAANVFGVAQFFTWATMPTALTNKEASATMYLKFSPFFTVAAGGGTRGPEPDAVPYDSAQMVFDTFGYYTNMPNGLIHSFAFTNTPGANSLGWGELNATNINALTSPWCDKPTTYNDLVRTNSRTRGAKFAAHYLQVIHTNWMTKY